MPERPEYPTLVGSPEGTILGRGPEWPTPSNDPLRYLKGDLRGGVPKDGRVSPTCETRALSRLKGELRGEDRMGYGEGLSEPFSARGSRGSPLALLSAA